MQLLSASGELKSVSARSSPIGGIDVHQIRAPGAQAIPLVRLPSGEMRMLAISRIYRTNPYIMACSHLLARNLSSIPVRTYITEADGSRRRLRSDKPKQGPGRPEAGIGLDLLARKPAPRISRRKIIFKSVIDICAFGNSLQFFNWGDYGPNQLWPIPWRRVMVDVIDPITIDHWDIWGAAGRKSLSPEQCIHITWGDDPESPIGVSPIESLQYTIALHNAIDRHLVSFYGNAARPSGLLKLSQAPKDNQIEQIREQFRQLYTAPESAGNVIITSGDYQPIAEATGVPTLVELVYKSRAEILAVYGVDPPMIGDYSQAVKCLPGDVPVFTGRGPIPIEDVEVGELVWSYVNDATMALRPVIGKAVSGFEPCLTIRTMTRTLRCSPKHPVLVRHKVLTHASVGHPRGSRFRFEHAWVEAQDLQTDDIIVTLTSTPDMAGCDLCPTREVSEGFAEFCGLLLGDGTVTKKEVIISRSPRAEYMDHYRPIMRGEFSRQVTKGLNAFKAGPIRLRENEQQQQTRFSSMTAAAELKSLGLGDRGKDKCVPGWVFGLTPKLRAAFLRGFLDADGTVNKDGHIVFLSMSRKLTDQLRHLCMSVGVPVSNLHHAATETGRFPNGTQRRAVSHIWSFICSDPAANREVIGSNDPRYWERWSKLPARGPHYGYTVKRTGARGPLVEPPEHCTYNRVVEITRSDVAEPVWDLEVAHGHSFVAAGVVVKNSNMQEARGKFVRDTLGPWATLHEDEWWAQMISQNPLWDYHWWQFDLDERLRPDLMERAKAYALLGDTLTTNERRRKENVEDLPFPEADTVWMGSGKIPLGIGTPTTTSDLEPEPELDPAKFPELEPGDPEPGDEPEDPDDIDADPDDEGDD